MNFSADQFLYLNSPSRIIGNKNNSKIFLCEKMVNYTHDYFELTSRRKQTNVDRFKVLEMVLVIS